MSRGMELLREVRATTRMRVGKLVLRLLSDFVSADTPAGALCAGRGKLGDLWVFAVGQCKPEGRDMVDGHAVNYGMLRAADYWWLVEHLDEAGRRGDALLTLIDTPGADPSGDSVEKMLAWSVSASISKLLAYPGPSVSVVFGEGGSGGALALQPADQRLMLSDAVYSVIAPESCSVILHRDRDHIAQAVELLRPTAWDAHKTGIIDTIVDMPPGAILTEHDAAAEVVHRALVEAFNAVKSIAAPQRLERRASLFFRCGSMKKRDAGSPSCRPMEPAERQPVGEPPMRKFVEVGGDSLKSALYGAQQDSKVLCPKDQGGCGALFAREEMREAGWACPICGRGERLSARQWISVLCDPDSFCELLCDLDLTDLNDASYDTARYRQDRCRARDKLGVGESLVTGIAAINGVRCAMAVSDFRFMGGTLSAVGGEKMRVLCDLARTERLPLVSVTCSGGVRMHEGTLGLAMMAKTNAAIQHLTRVGLPHVSILADPCTGGALGSYATYATAVLAEPHALIAFAGPRVLASAGLEVPHSRLQAHYLSQFGGIDEVVHRRRMRARIDRYLAFSRRGGLGNNGGNSAGGVTLPRSLVDDFVAELGNLFELASQDTGSAEYDLERLIAELGDLVLVHVPELLQHTINHQDSRVRANSVHLLGQIPQKDRWQLHHALRDAHNRVRANAAAALLASEPDSHVGISCVEALLMNGNPIWRRSGLFVALRLGIKPLRREIFGLCEDPDVLVRLHAALAAFTQGNRELGYRVLYEVARTIGVAHVEATIRRMAPYMPKNAAAAVRQAVKDARARLGVEPVESVWD